MPKYEEQWLKEFFEQFVERFAMGDFPDEKLGELDNNFGRILIPDTMIKSPKFHLINEMFSFELNHGRDQLIIGMFQDPTSPEYYFEFYVFIALLDYFDDEAFSQKIKHASEEILRSIIEDENPLFFEKESESHDILIKTNHLDAFFKDRITLLEKLMVAGYLHYKTFLTRHPLESILGPACLQKLVRSWKKGDVVNLGKITLDAYDYIEQKVNDHSSLTQPSLEYKREDFQPDRLDSLKIQLSELNPAENVKKNLVNAIELAEHKEFLASSLICTRVIAFLLAQIKVPKEIQNINEKAKSPLGYIELIIQYFNERGIIPKERKRDIPNLIRYGKEARDGASHDISYFPTPSDCLSQIGSCFLLLSLIGRMKMA